MDAARSLAHRSTQVDPQNALGYFARFQALYHDGEIEEADRMAKRSLALNPNDYLVLAYLSVTEAFLGRRETSEALIASARSLVGNPPPWFDIAPLTLALADKDFETVVEGIGTVDSDTSLSFFYLKVAALAHLGRVDEAVAIVRGVDGGDPLYLPKAIKTFEFWQANDALNAIVQSGWGKVLQALGVSRS